MPGEIERQPQFSETPQPYIVRAEQLASKEEELLRKNALESHEYRHEHVDLSAVRIPKEPNAEFGQARNKDNYVNLLGEGERWFVTGVFDGVGDVKGSEKAGSYIIEELTKNLREFEPKPNQDNLRVMIIFVEIACDSAKQRLKQEGLHDAGTTISLSLGTLQKNNGVVSYDICSVNAGDSRGYLKFGDQVIQTTIDDTHPARSLGLTGTDAFIHQDKNIITANAFESEGINKSAEYSEFRLAISQVFSLSASAEGEIYIYHTSDGVTDNLRDDPDNKKMTDLNQLWTMEISRRIRAGISATDLALTARVRMDSPSPFQVQGSDIGNHHHVSTKPDDIAVTRAIISPPRNLEFQQDIDFREAVLDPEKTEFRKILAHFAWEDFDGWEKISQTNAPTVIKYLFSKYPNIISIESELNKFIERFEEDARPMYAEALREFLNLAYGKGVTQNLDWYKPYAQHQHSKQG